MVTTVTRLCERSRKGNMEGLRNFIEVDNHCALEVDQLSEGLKMGVPKPFQMSCINVDHVAEDRWGPPLVDADWHPFCQATSEGIERSEWEELYEHFKEMSGAAGVRKPNVSQKAKALWKTKAARDRGEEFYDPERKDNSLGRNKTRLELWEEHLKDPIVALDKALKCVED